MTDTQLKVHVLMQKNKELQKQCDDLDLKLLLAQKTVKTQEIKIKAQEDQINVLNDTIDEFEQRLLSGCGPCADSPDADTGSSSDNVAKLFRAQQRQDADVSSTLSMRLQDFDVMSQVASHQLVSNVEASDFDAATNPSISQLEKTDEEEEAKSSTSLQTDYSALVAPRVAKVEQQFKAEEIMNKLPNVPPGVSELREYIAYVEKNDMSSSQLARIADRLGRYLGYKIGQDKNEILAHLKKINVDANQAKHRAKASKLSQSRSAQISSEKATVTLPPGLNRDPSHLSDNDGSVPCCEETWPLPQGEGEPRGVQDVIRHDPLIAEKLCVFLPLCKEDQDAEGLRVQIEKDASLILPVVPSKRGQSAFVACQTSADVQKMVDTYPGASHWKIRWPGKKPVLQVINSPDYKQSVRHLVIFFNNVKKGQTEDQLQEELEQKAGISLPVKPHIPAGKNFAYIGCRDKDDAVKIFEHFSGRAKPWVPK